MEAPAHHLHLPLPPPTLPTPDLARTDEAGSLDPTAAAVDTLTILLLEVTEVKGAREVTPEKTGLNSRANLEEETDLEEETADLEEL